MSCSDRSSCDCAKIQYQEMSAPEPSAYGQVGQTYPQTGLPADYSATTSEPRRVSYGFGPGPKVGTSPVRVFQTGATRDTDANKLDYHGFLAPIVLERYAQYMHKHRVQSDGSLRDSDNWQKGMPKLQYIKSLIRHVLEFWRDPSQETACAIMFNIQGWLYEDLNREE